MRIKRSFSALFIFLIILSSAACSKHKQSSFSEGSSQSMISSSISSSSLSSPSSERSEPVNVFEATVDDVVDMDVFFSEENRAAIDTEYYENKKKEEDDWLSQSNNNTGLETIIDQTDQQVSSDVTWYLDSALFDNVNYSHYTLAWIETLVGFEITEARNIGEFYCEALDTTGYRMYSVLESEIGGYIYCFYNFYPELNDTILKATLYVPETLSYSDFSTLQVGDSIDKVIEITPTSLYLKNNPNSFWLNFTIHLLKDGVLYITYDENLNITEFEYYEDFTMYNIFKPAYEDTENWEIQLHDKNLPENLYDFTILPQDYPQ